MAEKEKPHGVFSHRFLRSLWFAAPTAPPAPNYASTPMRNPSPNGSPCPDFEIHPRLELALVMMREAYDYALRLQRPVWDFAVEIASLRRHGLSNSDLRWLVCRGILDHRAEVDAPDRENRIFLHTGSLTFKKRTCFVLTKLGVEIADGIDDRHAADDPLSLGPDGAADTALLASSCPPMVPEWDRERQELRVNGELVKQFKVPAPNQELILAAFQEEGWPPRIDDPLPPHVEQNRKRRLRDTISALNRCQKRRLIHFIADGHGEGTRWQLLTAAILIEEPAS
jgi:hypothetical protein